MAFWVVKDPAGNIVQSGPVSDVLGRLLFGEDANHPDDDTDPTPESE